jgi:signal transduction histidine kinase
MQGFADALLDENYENLDSHGQEYARRIVNSAKYMDTLLNDLLDYSRLSRADLDREPIDLRTQITELLAQIEKDVQEKGAEIELDLEVGSIKAHPATLRQILSNLVCNAMKFVHPDRAPRIIIRSKRRFDAVRLWVEDNGIGIAEEHRERIFGLFERLHSPQTYPGTGIGLAIVRKGAERMGGNAGVESVENEGSRFWVELPGK